MQRRHRTGACLLAAWLGCGVPAMGAADVYRCARADGSLAWSDQPCGGSRVSLQAPASGFVSPSAGQASLARQYDRELQQDQQRRDAADARWLAEHQRQAAEAERLRNAAIEGRVVAGMSRADVEHILGAPDSISATAAGDERWAYTRSKPHRSLVFNGDALKSIQSTSAHAKHAKTPPDERNDP